MNSSTLDRDTGLANMVLAAQPGDHGVVADWIEDNLQLDDLAAVLRAGIEDPRKTAEREQTTCGEFRYRQLDRRILLSMATYRIPQVSVAGRPLREERTGFVVCLCTPPDALGGMRRWGRWFPSTLAVPAIVRLWDDLGKDVSDEEE